MPWFEVHTEETVHGVYKVEAATEDDARAVFERGDGPRASVFETLSVDVIDRVVSLDG